MSTSPMSSLAKLLNAWHSHGFALPAQFYGTIVIVQPVGVDIDNCEHVLSLVDIGASVRDRQPTVGRALRAPEAGEEGVMPS